MNIKRAKEEIKDSIEAYLAKDDLGNYEIPRIRQRPILLLGAPGIGKTQIMEQIAYHHPPHQAERHRPAIYLAEGVRWKELFGDRIHHE